LRVGFNARLLESPGLRGWNRYTVNLMAALAELGTELFLYSHAPVHAAHLERLTKARLRLRIAPPMTYLRWEQRWLPRACGGDGLDVFHATYHFGVPWTSPAPVVLTLHDAIGHESLWRTLGRGRNWKPAAWRCRLSNWIACTRARRIITVSEYSKRDLAARLGIAPQKITVVYNAADPGFCEPVVEAREQAARREHRLQRPYVFYVGGWEERKNLPFLLRAFAEARLAETDLALAGGNEAERAELGQLAAALGIASQTRLLGRVDDPTLAALYSAALCFVYPSRHEGFGLQLCEAMAAGCPVLAARETSLPEVLGDGGETFSLGSTAELAGLLRKTALDQNFRKELTDRARRRSRDFSWRRAAGETMDVYRCVTVRRAAALSPDWTRGEAT